MRPVRRHLTFANVASAIALFIALGGGTAVALSGSNTVFTDDIANDTQPPSGGNPAGGLTHVDLRAGSVGTSEVQNGSIGPADVSRPTANIVQRARGTASVPTGDGGSGSPVSYPLTNATWTQRADEVEMFLPAEVTVERPLTCGGDGKGAVSIDLDGDIVGFTLVDDNPPGTTETQSLNFDLNAFEPGTPDPHTLTVEVYDTCTGAGEEFIVHSVKVDVIGFR